MANNDNVRLPQRNSGEFVHPYKGTGKYSNYDLWSTTQLLQDAPLEVHEPGDGRFPHGLLWSRIFRGLEVLDPMGEPGSGDRLEGFRYRPLEHKGLEVSEAFPGDFGHEPGRVTTTSYYSNWKFDGLVGRQPLEDPGHDLGADSPWATFGHFDPYNYAAKSVTPTPLDDPGSPLPSGYDNPYGKNRVREWQGVPSGKAL